MYGLPLDFDGSLFMGRTVIQICISENTISVHFEEDPVTQNVPRWTSLTIQIEYSCGSVADQEQTLREIPEFEPVLLQLLGKKVTEASGTPDGTLLLTFENALRLTCFDNPQYESYCITHGQLEIIV